VELATGLIFALLCWHYQLSPELGVMAFYACLFIIIFVIDLEQGLILNKVVYPGMVVALLLALLPRPELTIVIKPGIASAALGGAIGFVVFLVIALVSRGGMGEGDIKMASLIGLATGFPVVLVALFIAILLGGLVAAVLLVFKLRRTGQTVPFGPFLSAGAILALLFGPAIVNWYLNLF
jgi:leader peptidase (prepilin peptidase)/N-methyltransferase